MSREIFLLCEYATLSGGEQSMLAVLDGIRGSGFAPAVIAPPEGPLADALAARDVEVVPFSVADSQRTHRPQAELREELARLLGHRRPRLLHANSLSMGRLSGPVAAELRLPSLSHIRDIVRLGTQAAADLGRHARLLAVSEAVRAYHVAQGIPSERTFVLHNGIDLDRYRPRQSQGFLHRDLGLPPEVRLVGAVGQIGLRKGLDVLAQAAALLTDRFPEVCYLIVGERWSQKAESLRFEAELRARADRLHGRIRFLGWRGDVDRLLNELTLLVHPARQEPLGRVLLEAAASGAAVVATDVGGTREIFPPQAEAALLVPPDDPAALAAAIAELLTDEARRQRLGIYARRRAEEAFSAELAAAGLIEHYHAVLTGSSG